MLKIMETAWMKDIWERGFSKEGNWVTLSENQGLVQPIILQDLPCDKTEESMEVGIFLFCVEILTQVRFILSLARNCRFIVAHVLQDLF